VVHNEPIAVRILDAGAAHAAACARVLVAAMTGAIWTLACGGKRQLTDASGMVRLSDALRNLPLLRVAVLKRSSCAPDRAVRRSA